MAATLLLAKIKIAGNEGIAMQNAVRNLYRINAASVASSDTGTLTLNFKPITNPANSKPVIIGLPHGISFTTSGNIITFTANTTYTNLDQTIEILGAK